MTTLAGTEQAGAFLVAQETDTSTGEFELPYLGHGRMVEPLPLI
jgi:hypothetical protein